MFSNCLSKVALRKNCQPLRGFPLPAENFSLQNFLRQKCEAFLASGFPLLHFAQRKIQQKLSASFRGFPSGGSSLQSKVMRGVAYYAKHIFDCLNILGKISENQGAQPIFDFLNILEKFLKIKGQLQNRTAPLFVKVSFPEILFYHSSISPFSL